MLWYVLYGQAEEYRGQEADGRDSVIVEAEEQDDALIKVMDFYMERRPAYSRRINGRTVQVIL